MTRAPGKSRFASRPRDPESWIKAADAPPDSKAAGEAFTARPVSYTHLTLPTICSV